MARRTKKPQKRYDDANFDANQIDWTKPFEPHGHRIPTDNDRNWKEWKIEKDDRKEFYFTFRKFGRNVLTPDTRHSYCLPIRATSFLAAKIEMTSRYGIQWDCGYTSLGKAECDKAFWNVDFMSVLVPIEASEVSEALAQKEIAEDERQWGNNEKEYAEERLAKLKGVIENLGTGLDLSDYVTFKNGKAVKRFAVDDRFIKRKTGGSFVPMAQFVTPHMAQIFAKAITLLAIFQNETEMPIVAEQ